ncbi:MAG: hypothetical protein AAF226_07370, partial [Verrucomicrobiota bacterium]
MADLASDSHEKFMRMLAVHEPSVRAFIRSGVNSKLDVTEVMQEVRPPPSRGHGRHLGPWGRTSRWPARSGPDGWP